MPTKPDLDALDEELMLAISEFDVDGVRSAIDRGAVVSSKRKRAGMPAGPMVTPVLLAKRAIAIADGDRETVRKFPPRVLQFLCDSYDEHVKVEGKRKVNEAAKEICTLVEAKITSPLPHPDELRQALLAGDKKRFNALMKKLNG